MRESSFLSHTRSLALLLPLPLSLSLPPSLAGMMPRFPFCWASLGTTSSLLAHGTLYANLLFCARITHSVARAHRNTPQPIPQHTTAKHTPHNNIAHHYTTQYKTAPQQPERGKTYQPQRPHTTYQRPHTTARMHQSAPQHTLLFFAVSYVDCSFFVSL